MYICREARINMQAVKEIAPSVAHRLSTIIHPGSDRQQPPTHAPTALQEGQVDVNYHRNNHPPDRPLRRSRRLRQLDPS